MAKRITSANLHVGSKSGVQILEGGPVSATQSVGNRWEAVGAVPCDLAINFLSTGRIHHAKVLLKEIARHNALKRKTQLRSRNQANGGATLSHDAYSKIKCNII